MASILPSNRAFLFFQDPGKEEAEDYGIEREEESRDSSTATYCQESRDCTSPERAWQPGSGFQPRCRGMLQGHFVVRVVFGCHGDVDQTNNVFVKQFMNIWLSGIYHSITCTVLLVKCLVQEMSLGKFLLCISYIKREGLGLQSVRQLNWKVKHVECRNY